MISVTVFVDSEHQYESIRMLGHAGQELVCAAVSALVLNMANSIEQFTDDSFEADQDEEAGGFNFRFTDHISPESRLLMNSLVFGLQNIEEEYGEPYIKIRFEEV